MTTPYEEIAAAAREAIASAPDPDTALDRVVALLHARGPAYTWVGVYRLEGDVLVLGPFRGRPSPHTRIPLDRGICGAAARERATIVVDDVASDPRYLACSLETRSEIVVPILHDGRVLGEIDIDSDLPAAFGERDRGLLEEIAARLAPVLAARGAGGPPEGS
jgi:putative methionine-R-sulfoxide reductase with GAF domain